MLPRVSKSLASSSHAFSGSTCLVSLQHRISNAYEGLAHNPFRCIVSSEGGGMANFPLKSARA